MSTARAIGRGAPGRRRVPRARREPEMLAAAMRVFAARGFHDASMDEIAAAAGVSKPLLYSYWGPKEELFTACHREATERLAQMFRDVAAADAPPDERLWHGLVAMFAFIEETPDAWLLFHGGGAASLAGRAAEVRDAFSNLIAELLTSSAHAEGLGEGVDAHLPAMAQALTGATVGLANWWLTQARDEPKELQVLRLMNLVWAGFGDLLQGRMWLPPLSPSP